MSSSDIVSGTTSHRPGPAPVSPLFATESTKSTESTTIDSTLVLRANESCSSDLPMDLFDISTASPLLDDLTSPASSTMQSPVTPFEDYSIMTNCSMAPAPPGTVSPKDLVIKDPPVTGPPSSFSTHLPTPQSLYESPDGMFSHSISPAFAIADYDLPVSNNWAPLIPPDSYISGDAAIVSMTDLPETKPRPEEITGLLETKPRPEEITDLPETKPRALKKRSKDGVKKNSKDGVKAPSPKPLKQFDDVDENDPVALKRKKNTLSARRSREKKVREVEDLKSTITELLGEVDYLRKKAEFYERKAPPGWVYSEELYSKEFNS